MAITTPILAGDGLLPIAKSESWAVNYSNHLIAGSLAAELKAAPSADGSATYLTHVTMATIHGTSGDKTRIYDIAVTLVGGDAVVLFGPIQLQANGEGIFSKDFDDPLKITDKKALDLSVSGPAAGYQAACLVYIEGFTGQKPI